LIAPIFLAVALAAADLRWRRLPTWLLGWALAALAGGWLLGWWSLHPLWAILGVVLVTWAGYPGGDVWGAGLLGLAAGADFGAALAASLLCTAWSFRARRWYTAPWLAWLGGWYLVTAPLR